SLGPADWRMDSRAQGWSITDVVAHMASGCRAVFTPSVVTLMRAESIERASDQLVDARRDRNSEQVLAEYRRWSGLFGTVMPTVVRTPLGRLRVPLAELGRFPLRLLLAAAVFDHHTHLRHDMAPALGLQAPATDANRMATVLEWMMAVLSIQLTNDRPAWLDRPLSITLAGPGGGCWVVASSGSVTPGDAGSVSARITAVAPQFPVWGTRRAGWRECDVDVTGDVDYATRFLNTVDIV
ncbi:MAG: maleylpyruvate isomerase N-terminal domain-containing protein, partial [Mycobacterium sp.]